MFEAPEPRELGRRFTGGTCGGCGGIGRLAGCPECGVVLPPLSGPRRYVEACERGSWRVVLAPRAGGRGFAVPYKCRSRRHAGPCATRWRRSLFCRIRDGALLSADPRAVVFVTWTLPGSGSTWRPNLEPRETWTPEEWATEAARLEAACRALTKLVSAHLRELNQRRLRAGLGRLVYLWVVEAHRSGVPHAHAVLVCPELAAELVSERAAAGLDPTHKGTPCASWLAAMPREFGRADMSLARSSGRVGSYLSKLAGETSKGQGSLSLGGHQRTYGASAGMLAPRHASDGRYTGTLATRYGALVKRPSPDGFAAEFERGLALVVEGGDITDVWFEPGSRSNGPAVAKLRNARRVEHGAAVAALTLERTHPASEARLAAAITLDRSRSQPPHTPTDTRRNTCTQPAIADTRPPRFGSRTRIPYGVRLGVPMGTARFGRMVV